MAQAELIKLGSTFGNVVAYNPTTPPAGYELIGSLTRTLGSGFQVATYYNVTNNQYVFAVTGTNQLKGSASNIFLRNNHAPSPTH